MKKTAGCRRVAAIVCTGLVVLLLVAGGRRGARAAGSEVAAHLEALLRAERVEERRRALSDLAAIRTVTSLKAVGSALEDRTLVPEAAGAAVRIACPRDRNDEGLIAPGVAPVLRKVMLVAEDPELRRRARTQLLKVVEEMRKRAENLEEEDFAPLFNGRNFTGWTGDVLTYRREARRIVCPAGDRANLYTDKVYSDFVLRFEFKLTPGANNGLAIRSPMVRQRPAYQGTELQILDDTAEKYRGLQPYQYHGSVYGVAAAERGHLRPVGQWNEEEVIALGPRVIVKLNGTVILDVDLDEAATPQPADGESHPGLYRTGGHIGFLGHGSHVEFCRVRIKDLSGPRLTPGELPGKLNQPPEGFRALFNGKNLEGWRGAVGNGNPYRIARMEPGERKKARRQADRRMRRHWSVRDGILVFDGRGKSLCTREDYRNFILWVDWKIEEGGDSGVYLRGCPQVQIWDALRSPDDHRRGSGGLFNNKKHPGNPLKVADNPAGRWNTFRIKMAGQRVTVHLNGVLVVDNVVLENYWDRTRPIPREGPVMLQSHHSRLFFRNVYLRELPEKPPGDPGGEGAHKSGSQT